MLLPLQALISRRIFVGSKHNTSLSKGEVAKTFDDKQAN